MSDRLNNKWNNFSLHTWLILSSYGIMFAILSFIDELGGLEKIKNNRPWIKGLLSILFGIIFYLVIGLKHIEGAKNYQK